MKTTTALYVREDGKILIGEFPVEPTRNKDVVVTQREFLFKIEWKVYQEALEKYIPLSVECADQNHAENLLDWTFGEKCRKLKPFDTLRPGIYPIEGIRYEVREEPIERDESTYSHYEREAGKQLVTHFKKVAFIL